MCLMNQKVVKVRNAGRSSQKLRILKRCKVAIKYVIFFYYFVPFTDKENNFQTHFNKFNSAALRIKVLSVLFMIFELGPYLES